MPILLFTTKKDGKILSLDSLEDTKYQHYVVKLQTNFESIVCGFKITEAVSTTLCAPLGNSN